MIAYGEEGYAPRGLGKFGWQQRRMATDAKMPKVPLQMVVETFAMAIQLTLEKEHRLPAVENTGAYSSYEEALNAALAVVEESAAYGFGGTVEALSDFLMKGISEEEFWHTVEAKTESIVASFNRRER